jgi:hypothetical protein
VREARELGFEARKAPTPRAPSSPDGADSTE